MPILNREFKEQDLQQEMFRPKQKTKTQDSVFKYSILRQFLHSHRSHNKLFYYKSIFQ